VRSGPAATRRTPGRLDPAPGAGARPEARSRGTKARPPGRRRRRISRRPRTGEVSGVLNSRSVSLRWPVFRPAFSPRAAPPADRPASRGSPAPSTPRPPPAISDSDTSA
jgi:hypothetical protein